jgi:hypothetical protein
LCLKILFTDIRPGPTSDLDISKQPKKSTCQNDFFTTESTQRRFAQQMHIVARSASVCSVLSKGEIPLGYSAELQKPGEADFGVLVFPCNFF